MRNGQIGEARRVVFAPETALACHIPTKERAPIPEGADGIDPPVNQIKHHCIAYQAMPPKKRKKKVSVAPKNTPQAE